jgi:hypothetical protein
MKTLKVTPKNCLIVLARFVVFLDDQGNEQDREEFCDILNDYLNDLRELDVFGTDGQCDPRGVRDDDY